MSDVRSGWWARNRTPVILAVLVAVVVLVVLPVIWLAFAHS